MSQLGLVMCCLLIGIEVRLQSLEILKPEPGRSVYDRGLGIIAPFSLGFLLELR